MIDSSPIDNIRELFKTKKYDKVINLTKKLLHREDTPSWLLNIVGLSKNFQSKKTNADILSSLTLFERAFLNEKKNLNGLEGLSNLIATTLIQLNNKTLRKEALEYMKLCEKYYLSSEKFFENNLKFLIIGSNLFYHSFDLDKEINILKKLLHSDLKNKSNTVSRYLFIQNYSKSWTQKDHYQNADQLNDLYKKLDVLSLDKINFIQNKKIKIGLVSKDLYKNHSLSFFVSSILQYIDKDLFELNVYSFAVKDNLDSKKNVSKWYNLKDINNQEVAKLIQSDKVQILIDLMGHTAGGRIELFNSRICPIQVSWLGYCNTLGFKNVDYLIADQNLIFKDEEKYYFEKIVKLPNIWNCHSGFRHNRSFNTSPCIHTQKICFGSFNNFKKISDETIEVWSKILKLKKNSKLILKSSLEVGTHNLLSKFKKYGVDQQIEILHRSEHDDFNLHLKLYENIDIALDTFPYNGVTTTFEALWKGVPVITMFGYNFNSRCGSSILKNANLEYLIATDKEDYVNKVISLSENFENLNQLRRKIFDRILKSPLFDNHIFARDFYGHLLKVYNKYFQDLV